MARNIEVKGYSGCPIDIVRENNDLFIYKSSYDRNYLDRLVRQAEKQQAASRQEYQHIRIPEIYNVAHDDHHVTIKMEYVYSRNFIEYFESAGFEQIDYFVKAIILFIEKELAASPVQMVQTSRTLNKFEDVKKKILENPLLGDDKEILEIIAESEDVFGEFAQQGSIKIPLGLCHGDLTFSNILFNGNNYYLIDFLDSFIESPLLDIVKIRQDSAFLWSQLMYIKPYDKLRLKIICNKIDEKIDAYFRKYAWYREYYGIYQLMNLLRILQYAKEQKVINYLKDCVSEILVKGRNNKSNTQIAPPTTSAGCLRLHDSPFSLIVPAASDNKERPDTLPYVFSLDENGIMLCIRAIQGLNLDDFDYIYFTILRKHAEKFCLAELFSQQFKRLGLKKASLVILDKPTSSQPETVYQTIVNKHIRGSIFIKDADGYFRGQVLKENGVALYPLEDMTLVNPQNKSYVSVDDAYYLTNIIEKKIVSHYFNVGGVCFEDASLFGKYFVTDSYMSTRPYMSHIVYSMLLDGYKFRPIMVENYKDWGDGISLKMDKMLECLMQETV